MSTSERQALLAGLSENVVEVGVGDGCNFAHYPGSITHVGALDPEPHLRERAHRRASTATALVAVVNAVGSDLPLDDGSFGTALCAV